MSVLNPKPSDANDLNNKRLNDFQWDAQAYRNISVSGNGGIINNDNPFPVYNVDLTGRSSSNSVFGDNIVGSRVAQVSGQFQYGFPSTAANSTIVSSGSITFSESMLVLSSGTSSDGKALISNRKTIRYIPGYESFLFFTAVLTQGVADSYQRAGLYDDSDGYYFGYEGELFSFSRRRLGVDSHIVIDLDSFNSKYGYTLDPTKGNVYKISYGYLGFATVTFEVLSPSGTFLPLATIDYPNSSSVTHISQTFLSPRAEVFNDGNTSSIVLKSGSFSAGIVDGSGQTPSTRRFSWSNDTPFTVGTSSTPLVAFRSVDTFNSITNRIPSLVSSISYASEGNKPFRYSVFKKPTFTGSPTWISVSVDSTIEYAIANIAVSANGILEYSWFTAKSDANVLPLKTESIDVLPGDVILFTGITTSSGEGNLSIRWEELF